VYTAAARAERGEPALSFISSAAKCFASDVAMEVTTNAVQLFGGAGYTIDFPVERMMCDAKITQIHKRTNQIQASSWRGHCWRDPSGTRSAVEHLERLLREPRMLVVIGGTMSIDRVVGGEDRRYRVITAMGAKPPGLRIVTADGRRRRAGNPAGCARRHPRGIVHRGIR
jgi:hypothetical protein